MTELRRLPIHRALLRPHLVMGVDRELVLCSILFCITLIWIGQSWPTTVTAAILWLVSYLGLRLMASADPLMRKVYLRHIRYRDTYRPHANPWSRT